MKYLGLLGVKLAIAPLPKGYEFTIDNALLLNDLHRYRSLIGRLLYLNLTRPNIIYAVQQLSQYAHAPRQENWDAATHILCHLKYCPSKCLCFPSNDDFKLTAYCDADWASYTKTSRSRTGYCVFLGSVLISWKIKKQTTVLHSSAKVENRSIAFIICELERIFIMI